MLRIDPVSTIPIFHQIEDEIRRLIAAGTLTPGGAVPSVRDLARELRVNPATVAKAYQRLADAGVVTMKRGEGTFVSDAPPVSSKSERRDQLRPAAERYVSLAVTVGATRDETLQELERACETLGAWNGRKRS